MNTPKIPRAVSPVGILAEQLTTLVNRANEIEFLDKEFLTELVCAKKLAIGLDPYTERCTTSESSDLRSLSMATQSLNWDLQHSAGKTSLLLEQEMVSGHVEGQFSKLVIGLMQAKRVLEIGLFTGYSALAMAEALPEDGTVVALEIDPFAAAFAKKMIDCSTHGSKVQILIGPASQSLNNLIEQKSKFDLIFIDADKASYTDYYTKILEGSLLSQNGLICVDNTLMQGIPYGAGQATQNSKSISEFNELVRNDPRVSQVMLPIRDGLTLIRFVNP